MKLSHLLTISSLSLAGAACSGPDEEKAGLVSAPAAASAEEDPYDLLCDTTQTKQLDVAVNGVVTNRGKIATRVKEQCEKDHRFCLPDGFSVEALDRSVFSAYPFACLGASYDMANAGAMTITVPPNEERPNEQIVVAFTPAAFNERVTTSSALSGIIAHEFGHVLSGQVLGHNDITLAANDAPVDWIYGLGYATEFVRDGVEADSKQAEFLRALPEYSKDPAFIATQLPRLEASRADMVEVEGRFGCTTASTGHMRHVCDIFDQRIASITVTIDAYKAAQKR